MTCDLLSPVWAHPLTRPSRSVREWESMLSQARQSSLQGRLARLYADHGWMEEVPEGARHHLEGAMCVVKRQRHDVTWEADCIRRALKNIDTPIVMLKGAAYVLADLPPAHGRIFSDVDIMVERRALSNVENALFAAGWLSEERDAYNIRYYREWMHELPPMRHIQRGTAIDVHHTITPPTSRFKVDGGALLKRIQPIPGQPGLYTLHPVDMVLHSAAHLFLEGEFARGLRDLLDLNDLIGHFSQRPDFWGELLDRADQLGLQVPLSHALHHLERLFSTAAPQHLLPRVKSLDRSVLSRRVMSALLAVALRPDHPHCDGPLTGTSRWLLYVRSHHLRMPAHLMIPHLVRKALMRVQTKEVR